MSTKYAITSTRTAPSNSKLFDTVADAMRWLQEHPDPHAAIVPVFVHEPDVYPDEAGLEKPAH